LVEIVPISSIDDHQWNEFVAAGGGLVFHTWEWISILSVSYARMENISSGIKSDGKLTGIFPVMSLNAYGLTYALSLPSSSGGPIVQEDQDLNILLRHYLKNCNVLEIHSYNKLEMNGESSVPHLIIPLTSGLDKIRSKYEKNVRNAITKAERSGVKVRISSTDADIQAFYEIYKETVLTQAGPSRISFSHIQNVVNKLREDMRLFLVAELDQRIVGGLIGLFFGRKAFYWAAASKRGFNSSELLLDQLVKYSSERADLLFLGGGRYGAEDSLYFFKSRWGSSEIPAYRYHLVSGLRGKALRRLSGLANHIPQVKERMFQSR